MMALKETLHESAIGKGNLVVVGHRGCGMNMVNSSDTRMRAFKENTVASFNAASSFPNLHFIEFDVQGSDVVERRVTDLTLDEFRSYGPQKVSAKVGKPLFKKTKEGRVIEWIVERDDALCTLEEVFTNVENESLGFDIELKFDDLMDYEEQELRRILRVILDIVEKHAKYAKRRIIFSSFQPDAARLMRQMQDTYPVFFITKGGVETFKDTRRNSLEAAIEHSTDAGLQGIVSETKAIFKNPWMVAKIKECKLSLLTYGQLNNVAEAVYLQQLMGVDGVVVDFVREITEGVSGFCDESRAKDGIFLKEEGKEKPELSEKELSFLFKLIPELVRT